MKFFLFLFMFPFQKFDPEKSAKYYFDTNISQKIKERLNAGINNVNVKVGDVDNDGKKDVVIYYYLTPLEGGNMSLGHYLIIFKNYGSKVEPVCYFEPEFSFNLVGIKDNKIEIIRYIDNEFDKFNPLKINEKYVLYYNELKKSLF